MEVARRFHTLEGLRGVAAIAVALFHLGPFWRDIAPHSNLAVDLFFLISGIVIGHAYEERIAAGWRPTQFLVARVRRLAPLYMLGAILGVISALILAWHGVGQERIGLKFALALGFLPFVASSGQIYPLNAPCWSLFDELFANAVFGFSVPKLTDRRLWIISGLALAVLCVITFSSGSYAQVGGSRGTDWPGGLARVAFGFPLGLLLHRAYAAGRLPKVRAPAWLVVGLIFVSFFVPVETPLYDFALIVLVYPCLVVLALTNEPGKATRRLFDLAGEISYPLYVLHWPLAQLVRSRSADAVSFGAGIWFAAAMVLFAYAAARYFDLPAREWLRRLRRRETAIPETIVNEENATPALAKSARSPL